MTEELTANEDNVEDDSLVENEDSIVDADNPDEVEKPEDSAREDEPTTDKVEDLINEINELKGKLSVIRKSADKWQGSSKTTAVENLRLKAAFKAGLDEESLILVTADTEEGIAKQVEFISRRLNANANGQQYVTLAGAADGKPSAGSSLDKQIDEQLAKLNSRNGF